MQVVWFKRDLRIVDHQPLGDAARAGPVMCLYIAEPDYWALPDTSGRQWEVVAEGLSELDADLMRRYGARLNVRIGGAVEVLAAIHATHGVQRLWSHEETGNLWTFARDRAVAKFCRANAIVWTEQRQFGVFRGLASRDRWAGRWEAMMREPLRAAPASLQSLDPGPFAIPAAGRLGLSPDPCPERQRGGRAAGLACLESFLAGRGEGYVREMSSPLTAAEACSRLSTHIATGTLSMREIFQAASRTRVECAAQPPAARAMPLRALDAFIGRLHWHCHFIQKLESEPELEIRSAHPLHEQERLQRSTNAEHLEAWISGRTGLPFVDACMRSLSAGGWINFRMRAMLTAVASYHLALDWTRSGAALARLFADYEPGIHWPQVQMQSGQTGINTPRIYNPIKQSWDQDPEGAFIRKWVPEIAHLPLSFLHEPWRMSEADEILHGSRLGKDYPQRIVDPVEAARAAKARLTAVRRLEGYRPAGQAVFAKHGSRKGRGERKRRGGAREIADRQLAFDI